MNATCPTCGRKIDKSHEQRKLFHALCRDIGLHIGITPGKVKEAIKADFFGLDEYRIGDKWYRAIRPSETADRAEYSQLIDFALQWAAENCGFEINVEHDRRTADLSPGVRVDGWVRHHYRRATRTDF